MTVPLVLLCALLLDGAFGEPRWLWSRLSHPAVLMGRLVDGVDRSLNHEPNRRLKGAICLALLVIVGGVAGYLLSLAGPMVEILCAAVLLAQRSLSEHVGAVADGLRSSLAEGRDAVAMIVSRETTDMDESAVSRSAIESAAENLSDGVVAPAFWFLVGGLPAMLAYKCINTADSMIGYRTPHYAEFGWAAARTDDLVNLIPARLTAALIVATNRGVAFTQMARDARQHRSPNAGWPEAAMAQALGIALAGPRSYDGVLRDFPWVNGDGRRDLSALDIDAARVILWKAWGLMFAICACFGFILI